MRMTVMEGWPGDVLSLLTLALHWEMRMTLMKVWPGDVLSLLSLYLLLSSALRSLSLSLSISVFLSLSSLLPLVFLRVLSALCISLVPWFPCCGQRMAFLHAFVPHDREARTPLFLWEETGAENLLPSVQFLFLCLVVFPVLLPLWKQRNGNVMEDWWASCFLPPLLVVSLRGLLCFFEKKQRKESFFSILPQVLCFSRGFSVMPTFFLWFFFPVCFPCFFSVRLCEFLFSAVRGFSFFLLPPLCLLDFFRPPFPFVLWLL